jgi:hypothetical protein
MPHTETDGARGLEEPVDRLLLLGSSLRGAAGGHRIGRLEADTDPAGGVGRLEGRSWKTERRGHVAVEADDPASFLPGQVGDGSGDHQLPLAENRHPVAELLHLAEEVAVDEHRHPATPLLEEEVADLFPPHRIDPVGRFVEEQHARAVEEGLRQPEALLHPLRIPADAKLLPPGEAEHVEKLGGPTTAVATGNPLERTVEVEEAGARVVLGEAVILRQIPHLPAGRERADRPAEERRGSSRRGDEAEEDLDQRRLAGAVLAQKAEQRRRFHVEAHPPEGAVGTVLFFELFDGNDHGSRSYQTAPVEGWVGRRLPTGA